MIGVVLPIGVVEGIECCSVFTREGWLKPKA